MSTLLADTIRKTGGTAGVDIRVKNNSVYETDGGTSVTQNMVQSLSKQWVYFNYASTTAVDSFNVGSLTDEATGRFLVNMTNNFQNTSYAVNYTGNANTGDTFPANVTCIAKFQYYSGGFETDAYDVVCYGGSNLVDGKYNYTVAHGDLA